MVREILLGREVDRIDYGLEIGDSNRGKSRLAWRFGSSDQEGRKLAWTSGSSNRGKSELALSLGKKSSGEGYSGRKIGLTYFPEIWSSNENMLEIWNRIVKALLAVDNGNDSRYIGHGVNGE